MTLLILSGPSGVGKTTLLKYLLQKRTNICLSISYTTRAPRTNEINGKDYHFVDPTTFNQMIEQAEFAEYAIVHEHYYGTSISETNYALHNGKSIVFDIDYQGAHQLRQHFPTAISVLVVPPSLDSLQQRLLKRNTDSEKIINKRLNVAKKELQQWPDFDYIIKNDNLEKAISQLLQIYDVSLLRTSVNSSWLEDAYPIEEAS